MILPEPLPDETLASLLARLARLNGCADFCGLMGTLSGERQATSFINTELPLPLFCAAVGNAYGTAEKVARELTTLYARLQLGDLALADLREIECGKRVLSLGELTFVDVTALRYCQSCVIRDIAQHGFSYWHRVHLLPVMRCCPEHGDGLSQFTCKRSRLHQSFPLPGDALVQLNTRGETTDRPPALWSGIAAVAEKLLADRTVPHYPSTIRDVFLDGLRIRGLVTASGRLRPAEFEVAFKRYCHSSQGEPDEQILALVGNPKQLIRGITEASASRPFARVILVHRLFGEWTAFKERCNWRSILGGPSQTPAVPGTLDGVSQTSAMPDESAIRANHRQVCMD